MNLFYYYLKCTLSSVIVATSVSFVLYGIFSGYNRLPIPTGVNFLLLAIALGLLAYFESGQVAVVNLSEIHESQSRKLVETHARAHAVYTAINKPGIVERYLMGRQLCVIGLVFFISQLTSFPGLPPILPSGFETMLIKTGLPGVMITLTIGQLFPQLIADEYTIRFINIRGSLFFIKAAQFIESIGIFTHFSWVMSYTLVHGIFAWGRDTPDCSSDNPIDSLDLSRSTHTLIWGNAPSSSGRSQVSGDVEMLSHDDVNLLEIAQMNPIQSGAISSLVTLLKLVFSSGLTLFAAALIFYGILFNQPLLSVHPALLLVLLFSCMAAEFYLEGLQVAVLAVQHKDAAECGAPGSNAYRVSELIDTDKDTVKRFLIGRQFLVVLSMFTMASLTTYANYHHYRQSFLPPKLVGTFVLTGFCGVLFALNTVQLPAQMVAKQYPTKFLNLPGTIGFIKAALYIESSGIMHFGWVLFHIGKKMFDTDSL
mmetsp:Transcript_13524/g.20317  ORF Transcript_13524/g.20317 Transcript_13524/m.20317 type:complete len:482 (-) Transcript_13524:75-1520(-)